MMREAVIERILRDKVIAIVRGLDATSLTALVEALVRGGIPLVELTFDQKNPASWGETCQSIELLSKRFQDKASIGAGTVLTTEQVKLARDAGAKYIISPDANPEVIRCTRENDMVSIPGCMTPTEITNALCAGADLIKLFPAGILGTGYVKALRAPLGHVRMLAVGGVNDQNAGDFIRAGCAGIGVGGNLVNKGWIAQGEFDRIEALARRYASAVHSQE